MPLKRPRLVLSLLFLFLTPLQMSGNSFRYWKLGSNWETDGRETEKARVFTFCASCTRRNKDEGRMIDPLINLTQRTRKTDTGKSQTSKVSETETKISLKTSKKLHRGSNPGHHLCLLLIICSRYQHFRHPREFPAAHGGLSARLQPEDGWREAAASWIHHEGNGFEPTTS